MRESAISRRIQTALIDAGAFVFKVHGNEFTMAGLPDLIVCYKGYYIGIEVKNPETRYKATPRQLYIHRKIHSAGGLCEVVKSVAEALALLDRIGQRINVSRDPRTSNI